MQNIERCLQSPADWHSRPSVVVALREFAPQHTVVFHVRQTCLLLFASFRYPVLRPHPGWASRYANLSLACVLDKDDQAASVIVLFRLQQFEPRWKRTELGDSCYIRRCFLRHYKHSNTSSSSARLNIANYSKPLVSNTLERWDTSPFRILCIFACHFYFRTIGIDGIWCRFQAMHHTYGVVLATGVFNPQNEKVWTKVHQLRNYITWKLSINRPGRQQ